MKARLAFGFVSARRDGGRRGARLVDNPFCFIVSKTSAAARTASFGSKKGERTPVPSTIKDSDFPPLSGHRKALRQCRFFAACRRLRQCACRPYKRPKTWKRAVLRRRNDPKTLRAVRRNKRIERQRRQLILCWTFRNASLAVELPSEQQISKILSDNRPVQPKMLKNRKKLLPERLYIVSWLKMRPQDLRC